MEKWDHTGGYVFCLVYFRELRLQELLPAEAFSRF